MKRSDEAFPGSAGIEPFHRQGGAHRFELYPMPFAVFLKRGGYLHHPVITRSDNDMSNRIEGHMGEVIDIQTVPLFPEPIAQNTVTGDDDIGTEIPAVDFNLSEPVTADSFPGSGHG